MQQIKSEFFINNRARLRSLFTGTAPIVLSANGVLQQNGDSEFRFKQDSSFYYLTGLNEPGLILVMDKTKEYLILPYRPHFSDIAEGNISIELLTAQSGISEIYDEQEGWKRLTSRLKRSKHVAILPVPPAYAESYSFYTNPARGRLSSKMKEINSELSFLDISEHIIKMRLIKQPEEIASIEHAIKITSSAIKKINNNISKYKYEYEVDAEILYEFRKSNVWPAFNNVVSSGKNAVAIHHFADETELNESDLLVLDIGAEVNHYAADITRTLVVGEKMSKRQRQVFEKVLDVQQYATSLIKPGVVYKEYEGLVEHYMGEQLRELGLITTIDRDSVRKYFPHLTSHFLGLDTHDTGSFETVFQANMVITVEPGIYIPEEGIGIRLEDDILITGEGTRILTANLPSSFN